MRGELLARLVRLRRRRRRRRELRVALGQRGLVAPLLGVQALELDSADLDDYDEGFFWMDSLLCAAAGLSGRVLLSDLEIRAKLLDEGPVPGGCSSRSSQARSSSSSCTRRSASR